MTVRPILVWPDALLSQRCSPIQGDATSLVADLLDTMYHAEGRGLAAPQIGVLSLVFVMDATWKTSSADPKVFINPEILQLGDKVQTGPEGCLSIPGITADVVRSTEVTLTWTTLQDGRETAHFTGFEAICIQHEMDHLDGLVTFDRLEPPARKDAVTLYEAQS